MQLAVYIGVAFTLKIYYCYDIFYFFQITVDKFCSIVYNNSCVARRWIKITEKFCLRGVAQLG